MSATPDRPAPGGSVRPPADSRPVAWRLTETAGCARRAEPVRLGIPLPRGRFHERPPGLTDARGTPWNCQTRTLARWPDGSLQWVLYDTRVDVPAHGTIELRPEGTPVEPEPALTSTSSGGRHRFHTGELGLEIDEETLRLGLTDRDGRAVLAAAPRMAWTGEDGVTVEAVPRSWSEESTGRLRTTIRIDGEIPGKPVRVALRLHLVAGRASLDGEWIVHNPRAARHPGGCWDLGDPGSVRFRELAWTLPSASHLRSASIDTGEQEVVLPVGATSLTLCQDSSGGDRWNHRTHVDAEGRVQPRYRGFRVHADAEELARGERSRPTAHRVSEDGSGLHLAFVEAWQSFPAALRVDAASVTQIPWPASGERLYELQGGERRTVRFRLGVRRAEVEAAHHPLARSLDREWSRASGVFGPLPGSAGEVADILGDALEGESSFVAKREAIDEYGWRNFGELYADHEAANEPGLVSHYNNQYDALECLIRQFAAWGDARWWRLADDLARHVRDIDLYHTDRDRDEYNGGLFWHTDHYLDAATATHRCFSSAHAAEKHAVGGGPGIEHCYARGLRFHHYLTGDPDSRDAALSLGRWARRLVEGPRGLLGGADLVLRRSPSTRGFWKSPGRPVWRYPFNRGSGNAIRTLIDAHLLTGESRYLDRCEDVVRHVAAPDDPIEARGLDDPEATWSYVVLLSALASYLDFKSERAAHDAMYDHAAATLLHYARWMAAHEDLTLNCPEKLEFPNETWPAQDLRKSHVLLEAARYAAPDEATVFVRRADELFAGGLRQLREFPQFRRTRPIVLVMQSYETHRRTAEAGGRVVPARHPEGGGVHDGGRSTAGRLALAGLARAVTTFRPGRELDWLRKRFAAR